MTFNKADSSKFETVRGSSKLAVTGRPEALTRALGLVDARGHLGENE